MSTGGCRLPSSRAAQADQATGDAGGAIAADATTLGPTTRSTHTNARRAREPAARATVQLKDRSCVNTDDYAVFMATLSVRFRDDETYSRLRERAGASSLSGLAERLIGEGLRMDAHPGLVFRDGPAGRRAALASGPDVWEVIAVVRDQRGGAQHRVAAAAELLGLSSAQVQAAVRYYADFTEEIDALVTANQATADRELARWENEQRLLTS